MTTTLPSLPENFLALVRAHGFVGPATIAPPKDNFRTEVESFKATGAPLHGAGGAVAWTSTMAATQPEQGAAWQRRLPPDMKRGGPEIYRSLRSAGCASTREWISQQFQGSKTSALWVDLWNVASTIDFTLGRCPNAASESQVLATDDYLEIGLRRLASYVYETRTKDATGARQMLALTAPGASVDIAPSWMVTDATAHSKAEYQRDERVSFAASRRGGGAGGRGGKGKKGKGDRGGRGGTAPPTSA